MNTHVRRLLRLVSVMVLSFNGFAQSGPSLNGAYAFLASAKQYDSFGETGGAILSLINFDGAGNVSGTAVVKSRNGDPTDSFTGSSPVNGTYTTNPDGTGIATLEYPDFQFSVKVAMVITDGGKSIQFADGPGSTGPVSLNATLPGAPDKITGTVPGGFFLQSFRPGAQATGTVPLTLNRTYNDGVAVYSLAAPATGTGPVKCPDGSSGTWSATIPSATAVMKNGTGDFMMPVLIGGCGGNDSTNYSGLANLNFTPNGVSLVLHLTGFYVAGTGRATSGMAPNGSYGLQFLFEPFPNAGLQVWNFDGSGGITSTLISAGGTGTSSGNYTTNPDGSGTVTLTQNGNASAVPVTFAFVTADDGATIYVLRTSGGGGGSDVVSGTGHLQ